MKRILLILSSTLLSSSLLIACNGGGGGGSNNSNITAQPYPYPNSGSYNGVPYSQLTQPNSVIGSALTKTYPDSYLPNNLTNALQIAYGSNSESQISSLTAYVTMNGTSICSATPVYFDANSKTTFLVGAAHCFANYKINPSIIESSEIISPSSVKIYYGTGLMGAQRIQYQVQAIYLQKNYCYGATFSANKSCPNFSPSEGASGGQGNDIAVIQVSGKYGNPDVYPYPVITLPNEYPPTYTMAPVLSIGYGINNQSPNQNASCTGTSEQPCGTMFYVANYQYDKSDDTGYHYLYNSYYNASAFSQSGYSALICGGDSGGGDLFWTGSKWILLSEHTYGPSNSCGTFYNYLPNAATNVSAYYDWIQAIIHDPNHTPATSCNNGTIPNCVTNG